MKALPLVIAGCAVVIGCSPDVAPNDPATAVKVTTNSLEKPTDLLPLTTGNAWTYDVNTTFTSKEGTQSATQAPTLKVTGRNGQKATVAFITDNEVRSNLVFHVSANGVSQVSVGNVGKPANTFSPPTPMFQWPMKPEQETKWSGKGYRAGVGDVGPMTSTLTYKGEAEVDTAAGRFMAHRFDSVQRYKVNSKEYGASISTWFVPKVGIVRTVEIVVTPEARRETVMKLKSYTVK